jgi:8-hydroxy-5-deazaflavin:NADPH oxidoreductase
MVDGAHFHTSHSSFIIVNFHSDMRIAIIGTGNIGRVLGACWARRGHHIIFGTRRPDSDDVRELIRTTGSDTRAAFPKEAAAGADVVVLATPWHAAEQTARSLGSLSGKTLIDCINPMGPGFTLAVGHDTSASEQIAGWLPGANVVKAFSTTGAKNIANPLYGKQRLSMFLCGDNGEARKVVASLAEELGFEPVDCGPLKQARFLEPLAAVWINLAYGQGWGADFGFAVLKRKVSS